MVSSTNDKILKLVKSYPTNGRHKYHWVGGFDGVTEDLFCQGVRIAKGEDLRRTYCCGIVFEVWFKAMSDLMTLNPKEVKQIKLDIFMVAPTQAELHFEKGVVDALVKRRLGREVTLEEIKPGDLVQLWRVKEGSKTSGHTVIYLSHTDKDITYWSTQPSTNGIGTRTESFSGNRPVTHLYAVRPLIRKEDA